MRKILSLFGALFLLFFFPERSFAQVVINEFAVDSSPQQVELLNTGSAQIDISGWFLDDNGGTTYVTIPQNTILLPNSCVIFSEDFNLNKSSSDALRLFDSTANPTSVNIHLVDTFSYTKGPGVNNSFLRNPDGGQWGTGLSSFGSFNSTGTPCLTIPTSTPSPTLTPTPSPSPTPEEHALSYDSIYINEVLVYPESGNFEKIEIFNNNDSSVTLTNWFIDDVENAGSTPKQFSLSIPAKGYGVYELTTGIFNNDNDQVRLLDFNKQPKDSFEYPSSKKNKSWGRVTIDNDSFCIQEPSFGTQNNNCIVPTPSLSTTSISKVVPTNPLTETSLIIPKSSSKEANFQHKSILSAPGANHDENSSQDIYNQSIPVGKVLGEDIKKSKNDGQKALIDITLFASSSYSILAFVALFSKIRPPPI